MNINPFENANKYLAGGVNSPVRSFKLANVEPIFIRKAEGKYIYNLNGKRYIDFCLSWGAIILGHNNPIVKREVKKAINNGLNFGFSHPDEAILASLIQKAFPSMEKMRFVNSGTEAVMSAIRVARGFNKRKMILKFDGCYHGHSDGLLVKSGSGVSEVKEASSEGVPEEVISLTLSIPFNDIEILTKVFEKYGKELSCVIIEPVPANMGVIIPQERFLSELEKLCRKYEVLLIFDEVITGFRVAIGGAQEIFGIKPDITILGKIIGGGLPVGCFGGREEIMQLLAPTGNVYQAGTLSGNPVVMRAGISVLTYLLKHPEIYEKMRFLIKDFQKEWKKSKITLKLNTFSTIFSIFYTEKEVRNYEDAKKQNIETFRKYYKRLLENNILFPPSCFEGCFLSNLHNERDLEKIVKVFLNV
ncbi:MAG: glutamate-1-semialdehyde 2,1-aminomutase [Brevinematia bacterium]